MTKNLSRFGLFAGYATALALLLLSALSLWLDNQEFPIDSSIAYWSLGINFLFWGKFLSVPLALVCMCLWAKINYKRLENWKFFTSVSIFMLLFLVLAFTHYVFAWAGSSLANVGTATFAGDTYHLARKVQFDESSKYYLGHCTPTRFRCNFHQIFIMNPHYRPNNISLRVDQQALLIVVDSQLVYSYDGLQESCIDRDLVYCP